MSTTKVMGISVGLQNVSNEALPMKAGEEITAGMVIHNDGNGQYAAGLSGPAVFALNNYTDFDAGGNAAFEHSLVHAGGVLINGISGKADAKFTIPIDAFNYPDIMSAGTYVTANAEGKILEAAPGDAIVGYLTELNSEFGVITPFAGVVEPAAAI